MQAKHLLVACALALAALAGCVKSQEPKPWLGRVVVVPAPAAEGSRYPNLAGPPGGPQLLSWLEPSPAGGHALRFARWSGDGWGPANTVASGSDWFVNWADFPSVVPIDSRDWLAHWLQQVPGSVYAYHVRTSRSRDGGANWTTPTTPHDDESATEHGFVSLFASASGARAVWLDGRRSGGEAGHDEAGHGGDDGGAMTLRGAGIGPDGVRTGTDHEIDARVCDCCQTDVAWTDEGPIVVYRDRGPDEVRDIAITRYAAAAWSEPMAVHADGWRIDACPVNGPAVAAQGHTVAVAWFTAPDRPRVRLAFSMNGGRSFGEPIEVASGQVTGRVDVVLLADGRAVVSWLQASAEGAEIRAQPFTERGAAGTSVRIAGSDAARASGFPRMIRSGDALLFAWTETAASPRVRSARAVLR